MSRERLRVNQTWRIPFHTSAADGGAEGFSATIEAADFDVYKNLNTTQRASTAGFTVLEDFDGVVGAHAISIDLSDDTDAGFYANSADLDVLFSPDETVDSQTVVAWIAHGVIESVAEEAARTLRDTIYALGSEISTTTNNTTTSINCTDIVDAQTTELQGELLMVLDSTNDTIWLVRVIGFTYPQAAVELLSGDAMPAAVAAGDHVWRVGQHTATIDGATEIASKNSVDGIGNNTSTLLTRVSETIQFSAAGYVRADVQEMNEVTVIGAGTSGDKWRGS